MASRLSRRSGSDDHIWPGFVDGLATLLMVIIFVLLIFVLAQFFLSHALSGQEEALDRLESRVNELSELLSLERKANADLRLNVAQLSSELKSSLDRRDTLSTRLKNLEREKQRLSDKLATARGRMDDLKADLKAARRTIDADRETIKAQLAELQRLQQNVQALKETKAALEKEVADLSDKAKKAETFRKKLEKQRALSDEAKAKIAVLNQQITSLKDRLAQLSEALDLARKKAEKRRMKIESLGKRLNAALATKVKQLSRYRSEFFGRLKEILGDHPGIRVVGDRFVFQSEVLFASASAELRPQAKARLDDFASTLKNIAAEIPGDINWLLRVDGHTDRRPIDTARFPSNWALSTARAVSVVQYLIDKGIPAKRLAAAGFAHHQPLDPRNDEIAYRRNRRIEFKLTNY